MFKWLKRKKKEKYLIWRFKGTEKTTIFYGYKDKHDDIFVYRSIEIDNKFIDEWDIIHKI